MTQDKKIQAILEQLVKKAQKGDLVAFGQIYDFLVQKVYKYIYFKIGSEEAMDLTENVFLKVWENLIKYKPQTGASFMAWVFRIAHNLIVDHFRFKKEVLELDVSVADQRHESSPLQMTERTLSQDTVRTALTRLKDQYRDILTVCYLNDFDNTEAAKILNKSEGALRVQKFRALQEMKKVLKDMGFKF